MADGDQQGATTADAVRRAWLACAQVLGAAGDQNLPGIEHSYLASAQLLAVYVASSDGEITPIEEAVINSIFADAADLPTAGETARGIAADPDSVRSSIKLLYDLARFFPGAAGMTEQELRAVNPVLQMMYVLLQTLFDADIADAADPIRYRQVIGSLRHAAADEAYDPTRAFSSLATAFIGSDDVTGPVPTPPDMTGPINQPESAMAPLAPIPCPANLLDGEVCYAVTPATLFQERNVVRNLRYAGLSARARIMGGVSYRAGSYDVDRTTETRAERIATGTLCITDRRLIFLSDTKNLDLPFARLLSLATEPGIIAVTRSNAGRLIFVDADPAAVAVFEQVTGTSPDHRHEVEQAPWPDETTGPGSGGCRWVLLSITAVLFGLLILSFVRAQSLH